MKQKAVLENGVVVNVIKADDHFVLEGKEIVDLVGEAGIGCTYSNGEFSAPVEPSPIPPEPSETDIILAALAKKANLTDNDLTAARSELMEKKK